ncbi:MAG: biotin--[acetyl-CoA-carboxylase] ligase [bacterium]|nr:biotin--[acetyl-CoA-carboxylase] ligase [bacterium]
MERSLFELSPTTRWLGARLDIHAELDSTNLRAEELARLGAPEGTLVIADRQSAGRGRLGRSFFSPGGRSLYQSLVLRPRIALEHTHFFVFAASLAVARLAERHLPESVCVEIKWPNDVLLDGRKTCGINLPVQLDGSEVQSAILGIGLNVNLESTDLPAELTPIATSLRMAGGRILDRVGLAEELLADLEVQLGEVYKGRFGFLLDEWRKYFRMHGDRVRIGGPGVPREYEGVVEGIDREGALLLSIAGTHERVLAGDVTLLRRDLSRDLD